MGEAAVRNRGATRQSKDARRAMVLEAAARLIADEGLAAATMRRIAESAGISLGTLTHHFASVDSLLAETLERCSERFTETLQGSVDLCGGDAEPRLMALFDAICPHRPAAGRQWRLWLAFWSRAVYDPALARVHARRYRAWRGTVKKLLLAGIEAGSFSEMIDVDATTHELVALMDGLCLAVLMDDPAMKPAKARGIMQTRVRCLARRGRYDRA